MIAIVVLDDKNGMMFHQKRQSQDRILRAKILELSKDGQLWMNEYTKKQFEDSVQIRVGNDFLGEAGSGDYCFVEDEALLPWKEKIEKLIVFRWNRIYPSDMQFDLTIKEPEWILERTEEFAGYSHDVITMEEYRHV